VPAEGEGQFQGVTRVRGQTCGYNLCQQKVRVNFKGSLDETCLVMLSVILAPSTVKCSFAINKFIGSIAIQLNSDR